MRKKSRIREKLDRGSNQGGNQGINYCKIGKKCIGDISGEHLSVLQTTINPLRVS